MAILVVGMLAQCSPDDEAPSRPTSGLATTTTSERLQATTTIFPLQEPVTLSARATVTEPNTIHLEGELPLPDGALLTVRLLRVVRWELLMEDEPSGILVGNAGVRLSDGRFSHDFVVDDQLIIDVQKAEMRVPPEDRLNGLIKELSNVVMVCVELRTHAEKGKSIQPPSVVAAIGPKGERLATSPQKAVFGSLTDDPSNYLKTEIAVTKPSAAIGELTRIQGRRPTATMMKVACA